MVKEYRMPKVTHSEILSKYESLVYKVADACAHRKGRKETEAGLSIHLAKKSTRLEKENILHAIKVAQEILACLDNDLNNNKASS